MQNKFIEEQNEIFSRIKTGIVITVSAVKGGAGKTASVTTAYNTPNAQTTTYTYDSLGRMVKVVDPAGVITRTYYDQAGNVIATVDPRGVVTCTDAGMRPLIQWDAWRSMLITIPGNPSRAYRGDCSAVKLKSSFLKFGSSYETDIDLCLPVHCY